jgi:DNA invertase Pin-like site-specific DNA recombinase
LTETHVLLEIPVCKSLLQKPIFLRELLRQDRSKVVKIGYARVSTLDQKLDRLARSTRDLLETMETIREAGARFQSLSEPWADTTTHAGKLIMTVFAGIAEFERDLIRERTKAGRVAARDKGVSFGRPRKLNPEQAKLAQRLISEGKPVRQIAGTFNVHAATIYRLSEVAA